MTGTGWSPGKFQKPRFGGAFSLPPKCYNEGVKEVSKVTENVNVERYIATMQKAVQCATVSHLDEAETDWAEFEKLHKVFEETYPLVHKTLKKEVLGKAGLFYTWEGTDQSLDPIALIGHQDVVPVPEETVGDWTHPPFSGDIADGYLWGRGTVDMKTHVVAVLEAIETLLEEGYTPKRTVMVLFGYNEEVVGSKVPAAKLMAETLRDRGVHLESVIDEGGGIPRLRIPGVIEKDLAVVGIAEKGYADYRLTVETKGGHSSTPPKHTGVGILAKAITNIEKNAYKAHMTPEFRNVLNLVLDSLAFPTSLLGKALKPVAPVLTPILAAIPESASLMKTTTSVTMASGSPQSNVLPKVSTATINSRILPGMTMDEVEKHLNKVIGDKRVKVERTGGNDPSPVSPTNTETFRVIDELSQELWEKPVTAPYVIMGATDAKYYHLVCDNVYRHSPFNIPVPIFMLFHQTDERMPLDSFEKALVFFKQYIKRLT